MTQEALIDNRTIKCEFCQVERMKYMGRGRYLCPECHHLVLDIEKIERIVEGHLREYPLRRLSFLDEPTAPTSIIREIPGLSADRASVQERWLLKRNEDLRQIMIIERVLKVLTPLERKFVELRYFESQSWVRTCYLLKVSSSTLAEWRHDILKKFAIGFGYM